MDKLFKFIDRELEELEEKVSRGGKLLGGDIEYGDKLAHFKKSLLTNEAMDSEYSEQGGRSGNRGSRSREGGRSRESYESYEGGMSNARRRDSMGRYSRDGFMDKLMEMRETAPNEKSRRAIEKMIDELEN